MAFHLVQPASTHFDNDLETTLADTSHNSWFHLYKPQPVDTRVRLSFYEPPSLTPGGVLNTIYNSYSRHKINYVTSYNLWLPNQVEKIHTSHNLHTHPSYQYH